MKIVEALKNDDVYDMRVTYGDKWLVFTDSLFKVYRHKRYEKRVRLVYEGGDEDKAVEALLEE